MIWPLANPRLVPPHLRSIRSTDSTDAVPRGSVAGESPVVDAAPVFGGSDMDRVVEYDVGCVPELAVSAPVVMADDHRLVFSFNAMRSDEGGRRRDAGRAVVKVDPFVSFQFGQPNDEARPGHPLYERGFEGIAVYEVLESSWIVELSRQNQVKFPDSDLVASGVRHFLFPFHETTLEVAGSNLSVAVSGEPFEAIFNKMRSWLLREDEK